MTWAEKQLKKEKLHKEIERAMRDPRFVAARNKERAEDIDKAFLCFLTISVDYLYRKENYGRKRMDRFIDFVVQSFEYVSDDPDYFKLLAKELEKETGINCLAIAGKEKEN